MSLEAARVAFLHAAGGALRLDKFVLAYQNSHQTLTVTGWQSDGAPFAQTTQPFDGNPIIRAVQLARDVVAAHQGAGSPVSPRKTEDPSPSQTNAMLRKLMAEIAPVSNEKTRKPMSQKGSNLARLMGNLAALDKDAGDMADQLQAGMADLANEMTVTKQIVANVQQSVADLRGVNALYSNGSPTSGDSSKGSSA